MPSLSEIAVRGAREHNLKNVSVDIPRHRFVVITGLSGSGKSSLAFDTIYAEGQRRYLESLSAYVRQFLEQMRKPELDSIDGLSPAISIEQKQISRNPRSTVGTVTEVYDFLRLLFSRIGTPKSASSGDVLEPQSVGAMVDRILKEEEEGTRFAVLAPIVRGKKGEYQKEIAKLRADGFVRAHIDGEDVNLAAPIKLQRMKQHDISVYVDRLVVKDGIQGRLADAFQLATKMADGVAELKFYESGRKNQFVSTRFASASDGTAFPDLQPRSFSFNSPHGACPSCSGLGHHAELDPTKVIPNPDLSILEGAVAPWATKTRNWILAVFEPLADKYRFRLQTPFGELDSKIQDLILNGSGKDKLTFRAPGSRRAFKQTFEGIMPLLQEKLDEAAERDREALSEFLTRRPCSQCQGARLRPESLQVYIGGKNIAEVCDLAVPKTLEFLQQVKLTKSQKLIAEPVLKEIFARLEFLSDVGLSYLSLNRTANTLSGGEAQRIRLATQIGSNLVGVLYVLDEPSIGLHQRDNDRLIDTLKTLRDAGNSVIVVEHDEDTIKKADYVVDLGPYAGKHGGGIVFSGSPGMLEKCSESLTGRYLAGKEAVPVPSNRREGREGITLKGANLNNLRGIDSHFPLGVLTCVTGVSGSGKSSLVIDTLLPCLKSALRKEILPPIIKSIDGLERINKVIHVDQSPIGRSPRSNPATYTGLFTEIRTLFAGLPESKARGYTPSRFSFNVPGGRCEACSGDGTLRISMNFLPDVFVECEVCQGRRYNRETLEVRYRGKNISDVLSFSIEEASQFFERIPAIRIRLQTLMGVGMGYVTLGQSATTLSGGEAQRIKLSRELNRRATGKTLYILDEPTTGLHFADVKKLLEILQDLVDQGNTVIIIEHNLDVIKQADHVIDLGPEGGEGGGEILVEGTPEKVATHKSSYTGKYLKEILGLSKNKPRHRTPSQELPSDQP